MPKQYKTKNENCQKEKKIKEVKKETCGEKWAIKYKV